MRNLLSEKTLTLSLELPDDKTAADLEKDDVVFDVDLGELDEEGDEPEVGEDEDVEVEADVEEEPAEELAELERELAELFEDDASDDADEGMYAGADTLEGDDDDDVDEGMYEGDDDVAEGDDDGDDDEVVEIDENMLRKELARMRQLFEGDGITDFGGGKAEGDPFTKPPKLNKLAEMKSRVVKEVRKNRALTKQLVQAKNIVGQLHGQLAELNLFNAKLLYANKLLQNENLSRVQKLNIVKSLDKAESLREAKLLYKSLLESTKTSTKGNLSESRQRVLGSASRATRSSASSAAPELARWAQLAGLK